MGQIYGLEDWTWDKKQPGKERHVFVHIHLRFPPIKQLLSLTPKERLKANRQHLRTGYAKLVRLPFLQKPEIIGTQIRPSGIKATVLLSELEKLKRLNYIWHISVKRVSQARKKTTSNSTNIYCVKLLIVVQVEGQKSGMQSIEDRFILVKARSQKEACKKAQKQAEQSADPYINIYGELVRWKVESVDDCYIINEDQVDLENGTEVYSHMRSRRMMPGTGWNGKTKN